MKTAAIARLSIAGSPGILGNALGVAGRPTVAKAVARSGLWKQVSAPAFAPTVDRMIRATRAAYPAVYDELLALAEGLGLPFDEVFAWNARGDLLATAGEGCTTVQIPGPVPVIAHNEDGLPTLRNDCFLVDMRPEDGPEVMSFCYPGSIPGHSFAVTGAGLVMTVNNLRLLGISPEIPRMVLTRAILAAPNRAEAVEILRAAPPSGGFHLSLGEAGATDIWSVSFGGGEVSVVRHTAPALHSNHALCDGIAMTRQTVTDSSRDRLARGRDLLTKGAPPLTILRDTGGRGLPIFRDAPDDPDEENTIAQFIARISAEGTGWEVHEPGRDEPSHQGFLRTGQSVCHA